MIYLTDITMSIKSDSLEDVRDRVQSLIEYAEQQGFSIVDGRTTNVREREPVESIAYAASSIYRNEKASEIQTTRGQGQPVTATN